MEIRPVGQETAAESGVPTLRIKSNLSGHLAAASALFARQAYALEQQHGADAPGTAWLEHRSYSIGSVVMAASFLEAAINELYLEAIDRNPHTFGAGHQQLAELLEHFWENVEPTPILTKYQVALTLGDKAPFPKGEEPYQGAEALILLRNALMHFKPEWDSDLEEHKRLEHRLKSRFSLSPFGKSNQAYFPNRCLGHGCAAWAAKTSVAFWRGFMSRMGLPQRPIIDASELVTE